MGFSTTARSQKGKRRSVALPIALTLFLGTALTAQVDRNREIPLKNWATPMYWQAAPAEIEAAGVSSDALLRAPAPESQTPLAPTAANSLIFVAMTPCRVVDTRATQNFPAGFGQPSLSPGPARTFAIQSSTQCSIPSSALAYSFNVTVVPPGPVGYLTMYPHGASQPNAVTLDDVSGQIVNNAAIVPAGTPNGSVDVVVSANTDVVLDINGYFATPAAFSLAAGKATDPSLTFGSDFGTGIWSAGAGTLNFSTGLVNRFTIRPDGDLDMSGNLRKGGVLFLHNREDLSTGVGLNALGSSTASANTAIGTNALSRNGSGNYNTATGAGALYNNIDGASNTGVGDQALYLNTSGNFNTAMGDSALYANTGSNNTGTGASALGANTTGSNNTAMGAGALGANTLGGSNVATGAFTLAGNTNGAGNTADGFRALVNNTSGSNNTAVGYQALVGVTTSGNNTAVGYGALGLGNGGNNIAVGYNAGSATGGNNNIHIGHSGVPNDGNVIRIGTPGTQTSFFAAGIRGVTTGSHDAVAVMIDFTGQLGTINSSRRFKEDIRDMAAASSGLLHLRPVTYRYNQPYADGSKPVDYGLIAEEVAEIYPDLVVKNAAGEIQTVQYHKLTPMLLNELQKEHRTIQSLRETTQSMHAAIESLQSQLSALQQSLAGMGVRKVSTPAAMAVEEPRN